MFRILKLTSGGFDFFSSSGVHNRCIFQTDVGGPQAEVWGTNWDFAAKQPDGDESVDTWYILQEREKICGSQYDCPEQTIPHNEKWHNPLHYEVLVYNSVIYIDWFVIEDLFCGLVLSLNPFDPFPNGKFLFFVYGFILK